MTSPPPRISEYFRGKIIFITGCTGFLGKVLLEKLLYSCTDLETIYVLIRNKKGETVQARLRTLLESQVFSRVRSSAMNHSFQKVIAVEGDVSEPKLGLSSTIRETLENHVNVVFHCAARVRFDDTFQDSVPVHVGGVTQLLQLAERMKHLESFVHVSTAYSNCHLKEVIQERIYPTTVDPETMLKLIDALDGDALRKIEPNLLGGRPNSYIFSKALAEYVACDEKWKLPIAIVRPSIVGSAWKEPTPGWVETYNGVTGVVAGTVQRFVRSMIGRKELTADVVPVDLTTNFLIAVAWYTGVVRRSNGAVFYNFTSGGENPITWQRIRRDALNIARKQNPRFPKPSLHLTTNVLSHNLVVFISQDIPAAVLDTIGQFKGRKHNFRRIQATIKKMTKVLEFFTIRDFKFENKNGLELSKQLNPQDWSDFEFDITVVEWTAYLEQMVLGTMKFVLKKESVDESKTNRGRPKVQESYVKSGSFQE